MTAQTWIKLSLAPFFLLLAVGSSSPKKKDGDPAATSTNASSATLTGAAAAKPAGTLLGHCDHPKDGYCKEIYVFGLGGEASERKICETLRGTYEPTSACPTRDTLWGVCSQRQVKIGDETPGIRDMNYYYNEGINRSETGDVAKGACDAMSGEWNPGPASKAPPAAPPAKKAAAKKK